MLVLIFPCKKEQIVSNENIFWESARVLRAAKDNVPAEAALS